jgi:hypothetical protein
VVFTEGAEGEHDVVAWQRIVIRIGIDEHLGFPEVTDQHAESAGGVGDYIPLPPNHNLIAGFG